MKKEIIKIIFIASLAFNLAFISAGIYRTINSGKIEKSKESAFAGRYGLSEKQNISLEKIVKNFRIKLTENKSDVLEKRIDIIELLGDPEFMAETLEEELLRLNDIEAELNNAFVSTLLEISTVLDQGQWIKFLYNLSKGWFFSGSGK